MSAHLVTDSAQGLEAHDSSSTDDTSSVEEYRPSRRETLRAIFGLSNAGVIYAFLALVGGLTVLSALMGRVPYLSEQNVANLLEQTSSYAILSVAMAVLLISGSFDLSVGSLSALCALVAALAANAGGPVVAIVAALLVGAAGGIINGTIHWKVGLNPFIVTLGTLSAFRGLSLVISDGRTVSIRSPEVRAVLENLTSGYITTPNLVMLLGLLLLVAGSVALIARRARLVAITVAAIGIVVLLVSVSISYELRLAKPVYYAAGFTAIVWFTLRYTIVGRRLYATGGSFDAAAVAGIRVAQYKVFPFILVGLAAGVVGIFFVGRLGGIDPGAFQGAELTVLAAAIVGGVAISGGHGDVLKTVVGALLLFTIANGFNMLNVGANYQQLFSGVLIVAAATMYVVAERRQTRQGSQ